MDQIHAFASAYPFSFAAGTLIAGFCAKTFLFTKANAQRLVRTYFTHQRSALTRMGLSDAQIDAAMAEEADFLMAAAQEAKAEADTAAATPGK